MYLCVVVLLVALSRLLPHPPNFTCIGAFALFAGCSMRSSRGVLLPLLALLLSDVVGHVFGLPGMGFYGPVAMLCVYGGVAAVAVLGRMLGTSLAAGGSGRARIVAKIGVASLAASTLFFLASNLGVFLGGAYGWSLPALLRCYVSAIPFFGNTVGGDLFYGSLLFGSAAYLRLGLPIAGFSPLPAWRGLRPAGHRAR